MNNEEMLKKGFYIMGENGPEFVSWDKAVEEYDEKNDSVYIYECIVCGHIQDIENNFVCEKCGSIVNRIRT